DNRLDGDAGNDTLSGGDGTDTAVFDVASTDVIVARTATGVRIIVANGGIILSDDHVADDVEVFEFSDRTLSREDLAGLIISGTDADETLVGTAIADNILGRGGNDTITGLGGHDALDGGTGADSLSGDDGNDTLDGGTDDDRLAGGPGDDLLIGGTGRDHFTGGPGDDSFVIDDASEVTVEAPGQGRDHVVASVSVTLQDNVE
ncbi:MAG: hypothetical protein KDB60_20255, partial [Propionibacteriaceae bacterium]|nr:hypothetical protein [Propionibacteriaceae bacterium]